MTVLRAETVINVTGGLDELASVIGSAASLFGILHSGKVAVIVAPFTARRLAKDGWSRADVRRELYARGRLPVETWRRSWLHATVRASDWPEWVRAAAAESGSIPAVREPDDLTVIVAGADLADPAARLLSVVGPSAVPGHARDRAGAGTLRRRRATAQDGLTSTRPRRAGGRTIPLACTSALSGWRCWRRDPGESGVSNLHTPGGPPWTSHSFVS